MLDKQKLHDNLQELFMSYQYRLDNPLLPNLSQLQTPALVKNMTLPRQKYLNDDSFRHKVDCLVNAVMDAVEKSE